MKQYSKLLKETTSPSKFLKEVKRNEEALKELVLFISTIEEVCNFLGKKNNCKNVAAILITTTEAQFIKFLSLNLPASVRITAGNFANCVKRVSERRSLNELEGVEVETTDTAKAEEIVLKAAKRSATNKAPKKA